MSKTDKTAPWWVQAQDQLWEPVHLCVRFHRPCDLPSSPPATHNEAKPNIRSMCRWSPTDWHKITFSRYSEWHEDKMHNRSRAKRKWRKDWEI